MEKVINKTIFETLKNVGNTALYAVGGAVAGGVEFFYMRTLCANLNYQKDWLGDIAEGYRNAREHNIDKRARSEKRRASQLIGRWVRQLKEDGQVILTAEEMSKHSGDPHLRNIVVDGDDADGAKRAAAEPKFFCGSLGYVVMAARENAYTIHYIWVHQENVWCLRGMVLCAPQEAPRNF